MHLPTWGVHLLVPYRFAFSHCSWGFERKDTEKVCHSLLQWTTFCQNSPPWPVCLGWPYRAWLIVSLSYTRLWSMWSVWLLFCDCGFHSICPLMEKDETYGSFLMAESDCGGIWFYIWGGGGAMLSKSLIQFSVDGRGCVPFQLFGLRPNYGSCNDSNGDLLQKDWCPHFCI